jgi:hypothetical protein
MQIHILKTAALAAVLMFGAASVSAYAVDVTIGGGSGNVVSGTTGSAAGTSTGVAIGTTPGPLVDTTSNGSTTNGKVNLGGGGTGPLVVTNSDGSTTNGQVNLNGADLLGLLGGTNGGAGNGFNEGRVNVAVAGLSGGGQAAVKLRCRSILASPDSFDTQLVQLCRIVAKMN